MSKDKTSKTDDLIIANHYEVEVPIYGQVVLLFTEAKEFQSVIDGMKLDLSLKGVEGYALRTEDTEGKVSFMMYIPNNSGWDVVAHECHHMTSMIMDLVGVRFDPGNDEPFAYLHGYLVGQVESIRKSLQKKPVRKKRTARTAPSRKKK